MIATVQFWIPSVIFRPTPLHRIDPAALRVPGGIAMSVRQRGGGTVTGVWVRPHHADGPVALIVHGRSANISTRIPIVRRLAADGMGVLLFDYRGYGASIGRSSEQHWLEDTITAYRWLRRRGVTPAQIVVIGQSLGNSAAARLAATQPVGDLVLVAPFTNLPDALATRLPLLPLRLVHWTRNRFDVGGPVRRFRGPKLFVTSATDGMVPIDDARRVLASSTEALWLDASPLPHDGMLRRIAEDGRLTAALHALRQRRPIPPG